MEEVYKEKKVPVGQKMAEAVEIIKKHPGCTKLYVAREVGPRGSTYYGDRVVVRCLKNRIVINASTDRRRMELYARPLSKEQMEVIASKRGCSVHSLPQWWVDTPSLWYRFYV